MNEIQSKCNNFYGNTCWLWFNYSEIRRFIFANYKTNRDLTRPYLQVDLIKDSLNTNIWCVYTCLLYAEQIFASGSKRKGRIERVRDQTVRSYLEAGSIPTREYHV